MRRTPFFRTVARGLPGLALALVLSSCITATSRTCSSTDGTNCTAYTGIAWTESQVRDRCAATSATFSVSACATSPYGTCIILPDSVSEARIFTYGGGLTEAIVESGCCAGGGSNATWVSASGARRPCASGGGIDETAADGI